MIITTTSSIDGKRIVAYHGIAAGEAIMGANIFRDIFASVTDFIGGRSGTYERVFAKGRASAMEELESQAASMGGNAVVGVNLDYEIISGGNKTMLMVCVTGTVVTFQ